MTEHLEPATEMMCADAGLHPDQAQAYLTELAAAVRGRWARQPKAERVAN